MNLYFQMIKQIHLHYKMKIKRKIKKKNKCLILHIYFQMNTEFFIAKRITKESKVGFLDL